MASSQFSDILAILLGSPQGLLALTIAFASLSTIVYIFLIKSSPTSKPKSKKTSATKSASPTKQSSSTSRSSKTTPAKKPTSNSSSPKKEATKSPGASKSKTSSDKKSDSKHVETKTASPVKMNKSRQSDRGTGSQKSVSQKDEGEWITVSKKKPRSTKKVSASPEQNSAPQTRMSTRRSTQAPRRT